MVGGPDADEPHPPTQADGQANAGGDRSREREEVLDPCPVEHVFAHQKIRFGLFIRTIGIARAEAKLTLANIAYNMGRLIFHERRMATG